jgi:hypothetical protein
MGRSRDDITPDHQQMDLSNDPEEASRLLETAPERALESRRQRLTGSAEGVGSVGFDDPGVFEIDPDDGDRQDGAVAGDAPPPKP